MKKSSWLLCALISGAAIASDNAPLPKDLYVRGAFNGWGTDNVLVYKGKGVYEAEIVVSPGNHAFKLGYKDWGAEWVLDTTRSVSIATDTDYRLDTHAGPEDFLFVKQTGAYRFSVDVSQPSTPVLRVIRVAAAPIDSIDPHKGHQAPVTLTYATWDGKQESARFSAKDASAPLREYAQSSTMQLRDPGPQFVRYQESNDLPTLRSGNLAFDALFALAGAEMKQDSVREIKDGNYNGGAAIACDCFETGEKWHYVWTRDLSYAADLGLAMLDPVRVMHSLDFKLSGYRPGLADPKNVAGSADGLQIVQDTGSGGSWPVSTDRVTWAFGAEEVLKNLPPEERKAFAPRALLALTNTIENDRLAAFDPKDGLYTGEQSFLDWRDQSYAKWITNDLASMASSKALSTNVAHYKALTLAATLAKEQGQDALAKKYGAWALDLRKAINQVLWLADERMFSSLTAPHFDGAPMHKFDWLGQALAVVTGIAAEDRARSVVARYPHGPMGAPVIYPQQPGMPVYHNRAMWPFVTAYGLKAAAITGNVSVADAAYQSLMRGAALNLSNMENLEWLSGQPLLLDEKNPSLIGPVINSKRQLWSVGAYLGMVIENVFGISTTASGIEVKPFITARLRRETFGQTDLITLNRMRLRDKTLSIRIHLPPALPGDGFHVVERISINGVTASGSIQWEQLAADSIIDVELGMLEPGIQTIRHVNADPYTESDTVFAPPEPAIANIRRNGNLVSFDIANPANGSFYNVYRDGKQVGSGVRTTWIELSEGGANSTGCYSVEAVFPASGNRSHHSAASCVAAPIDIPVTDARVSSNLAPSGPNERFAAPHLKNWGKPADKFTVSRIVVPDAGDYAIQVRYHNGANQINLGISGGVKWLAVKDSEGRVVARQVIQLPHARIDKANTPLVYSTPLRARLAAGEYSLDMSDFYNMSYLQSNSTFSAAGGADGASNLFNIYGVRLLRVQ